MSLPFTEELKAEKKNSAELEREVRIRDRALQLAVQEQHYSAGCCPLDYGMDCVLGRAKGGFACDASGDEFGECWITRWMTQARKDLDGRVVTE